MPRRLSVLATAAACLAAAAVSAGSATAAAPADPPTSGAPCATAAGGVRLDGLAFDPPSVPAGGTSTASLTATNCSDHDVTVRETWAARFLSGSSTGVPAGCPVIDPLPRSVTFGPHERVVTSTAYLVFADCTADLLRLTVTVSQDGVPPASRTADLLIG
ncbi:hypothetical protein [Actinacidiphila bryophytorum]|uniref:Uncharacterized protein n=2 Tax=Actinacidiphila bryophytorum TaxID=1436133 RepID=A0A9W4H7G4_9ACTN|nr:hypothetical protein [Actinacidiphila bryophytorum]MBM9437534.1 hypothetical protein [Actinacidiphila bryophytorum]CAG7656022.1 conserved exported hypothetical protein [Actinacidiphila bryophytorum]